MDENIGISEFTLQIGLGAQDPLEEEVGQRVRGLIEAILEEDLETALGRGRRQRSADGRRGQCNGHRDRQVIATFGPETVKVPRARLAGDDGRTGEWRSKILRRYQRLTRKAEALIASVLPVRDEHAAGQAGAVRTVRRGCQHSPMPLGPLARNGSLPSAGPGAR